MSGKINVCQTHNNLVLIVEINARMILYNFCELVTSHAVVKTSKNTCRVSQPTECSDHLILWAEEK